MPIDPKRIKLVQALLRFGGSKDVPSSVEASLMPDSVMEKGVGYDWIPGEEDDTEEDDTEETSGFYNTKKKKILKLQKIQRRK